MSTNEGAGHIQRIKLIQDIVDLYGECLNSMTHDELLGEWERQAEKLNGTIDDE